LYSTVRWSILPGMKGIFLPAGLLFTMFPGIGDWRSRY
jgi:hypothetical protein